MTTKVGSKPKLGRYAGGVVQFAREWMILALLVLLFIVFSLFIPKFADIGNVMNIGRQISFLAIASLGQFYVILTANLDMSIGSIISLISVFLAGFVSRAGMNIWLALILVFAIAVVIGITNGLLSVQGRVPSFIATLVTMNVLMGITYLYSRGIPISGLPAGLNWLGMGYLFSVPVPIYFLALITLISWVFTMKTELGRSFYAVGGNKEAARLSGINVNFIGVLAFVLSAVFSAIASIGLTAKTMAGTAGLGDAMLFDVMTVVVVGGTSLYGGRGNVLKVVLAAILIGMISNGMVLLGINTYMQWIVKGAILISVVLVDVNSNRSDA